MKIPQKIDLQMYRITIIGIALGALCIIFGVILLNSVITSIALLCFGCSFGITICMRELEDYFRTNLTLSTEDEI